MRIEARCHCGNLSASFLTNETLESLKPRACGCSFCRMHDAKNVSDPAGSIAIEAEDPERLSRYRFGLRTADFLVCASCGVYVVAVMEQGGRQWATINLRASRHYDVPATAVSYDDEVEGSRIDRRMRRWTPVIRNGPPTAPT
ncbi:MAG: hypothetical protein ACREVN_03320 [Gammaproteobacteria bacterium]